MNKKEMLDNLKWHLKSFPDKINFEVVCSSNTEKGILLEAKLEKKNVKNNKIKRT